MISRQTGRHTDSDTTENIAGHGGSMCNANQYGSMYVQISYTDPKCFSIKINGSIYWETWVSKLKIWSHINSHWSPLHINPPCPDIVMVHGLASHISNFSPCHCYSRVGLPTYGPNGGSQVAVIWVEITGDPAQLACNNTCFSYKVFFGRLFLVMVGGGFSIMLVGFMSLLGSDTWCQKEELEVPHKHHLLLQNMLFIFINTLRWQLLNL